MCRSLIRAGQKNFAPSHLKDIRKSAGHGTTIRVELLCFADAMRDFEREISNLTLTSELARMFTATGTSTWATPVAFGNLIEEDFFQNQVQSEDADDLVLRQHFASVDQKLIRIFH